EDERGYNPCAASCRIRHDFAVVPVTCVGGLGMSVAERTATLLDRLRADDTEALGELFMLYRERLWRMLYVRLDRRLARRVAPDDVLQETFLDVARRIGEYLADPAVPFYVWLRFLAVQRMQMVHRANFGAQMRDVTQEVALPV